MTDTVGFIRKLPHQLVDAFGATLEETQLADLLLHVVDASADEDEMVEMLAPSTTVLEEIGAEEQPRLLVLNKADAIDDDRRRELEFRHPEAVLVSALTGEGLDELGRADRRGVRAHAARRRAARAVLRGRHALRAARGRGRPRARGHRGGRARRAPGCPRVVAERYDRYAVNGNGRPA